MSSEISYGKRLFQVQIKRSEKKRISLIVRPDLSVEARVPNEADLSTVKDFLVKRAAWIAKQVDYFDRFHPLPVERKYESGETHLYLGKHYRLKIVNGEKQSVKLQGQYFIVALPQKESNGNAKELMRCWYMGHAREIINKRLSMILPGLKKYGIDIPQFRIQLMKRRWGSCSKKNNITFNIELIKVPIFCMDYVIAHELCHLVSSRHDAKFYRILSKLMSDWERRKARLEKHLI